MITISMKQLLEAGVHFGHQTRSWNPEMAPYIFGARHKQHIINLEKTVPMFKDMLQAIYKVVSNRGKILFVGTKFQATEVIAEEAIRCGMPYVNYRWLGGMLTNYKTIRKSIKRLKELDERFEKDDFDGLTKKERLNLIREKAKLDNAVAGIKDMGGLPDMIFIVDVGHEKIAVAEANRLMIPVAGIVDTNGTMDGIDYPVPGNDDAIRSIRLYCQAVADTVLAARSQLDDEVKKVDEKKPAAEKTVKRVVTRKIKTVVAKEGEAAPEGADKVAKPAAKKSATKKAAPKKAAAEKKPAAKKAAPKKAEAKAEETKTEETEK